MVTEMTSSGSSDGLTCEVLGKLPGLNDYTKACRGNKFAAAALKKRTEDSIWPYIRSLPAFDSPVRIRFTWIEKDRRRDLDNVAFAKKFVLDAMVRAGVLKDDSQAWVKGFEDRLEHSDHYGVRIEVLI